ncbi:MAG TPA: protein kinase, partial [Thermoanaerobaculia bacterium]|nr:protein kinase [Thermoanaerobaculia bacterium]
MADSRFRSVDASLSRAITRAVEEAGIRSSQKLRRVGSYKLGELLLEGRHFQDFLGTHDTLPNEYRRVRIYGVPTAEPLSRDTIARAAKREYQLLSAIEHPGILKVLDYVQHDLGPALLFEHLPGAVRLDHYLAEREKGLSFYARLKLLRQVAEALQNAHEHRLAHRALGPQSLLVLDPEAPEPKVKLFNWQTGLREASSASSPSSRGITGTEHITELVDDVAGVYIAPEARTDPSAEEPLLDVFSLGALAYRLFSGAAPAESALELPRVLAEGQGLNLSAAADGVSEKLRRLVKESTNPEVTHRLGSAGEFLEGLDAVENDLTLPSDGSIADPDAARPEDVLQKGFTVVRRLGTGSTALALLVTRGSDRKHYVLKLALSADLNDRLHAEAEVIRKLSYPGVVRCVDVVEIYGRVGLVLDQAGDLTLAQRLRVDGRLPLDLLQRWGEDLLKAISYLEEMGVPHRDLKPDNLGIARTGKDDALHLVLFDFSLSRAPLESIHAGTRTYLEPFLAERKPRRWDLAAERYAAAVTLHEMATGSHPAWGDGRSDPASLTCEATLDADHLEPSVKEPLGAFFTKALRRNHRERFDNAQEVLWAWQKAFTDAARPALTTGHDEEVDLAALVSAAKLESPLAEVGLSPNALSALDRAGITLVRDLLARPPKRLAHLRGAGSKTRKDIVDLAALLRVRFPEVLSTQDAEPEPQADADLPEAFSVDALVAQLLPKKIRKDATTEPRLLRLTLGIEPPVRIKADPWPAQNDVARELGISQPQVSRTLTKARERWLRNRNVTRVRDEVQETLRVSGGVLSASELEGFVLAARGSAEDEPTRTRHARAV